MCLYKIIAVVAIFTIACFLSVSFLQCFTLIHSFIHHWNYTHNLNNWQHKLVPQLKKAACHQTSHSESLIQSTSSQPTLRSILILCSPPTLLFPNIFTLQDTLTSWWLWRSLWSKMKAGSFTPLSELGTTLLTINMVSYYIRTWVNV